MALALWLYLCTVWYIVSNIWIAYRSWSVLPAFFAICYSAGLMGGLGDHLEPWIPVEHHWVTAIVENYIGRFPLAFGASALLLRYLTLGSLGTGAKLRTLGLTGVSLAVLLLHKPVEYNTDWVWHLAHSVLVHASLLALNISVFDAIAHDKQIAEKKSRISGAKSE